MKIAVVGCGAVGSFYGANLARAGHEVHFLLRSDYDVVRRKGVRIISPKGNFEARPKCAKAPEEIGVAEVVLIGLKTTANDQFPRLLPPLVSQTTAILTLQNGLGNEEQLAELFPPGQILGGLCFVCLNRIEPGLIHHLDHGQIMLGEYKRYPEPRTHDIASAFRDSGVPCKVSANLGQAHWEKLVWNIPFNGLGVAGILGCEALNPFGNAPQFSDLRLGDKCLTTQDLLLDERWRETVRQLMFEIVATGNALGFPIKNELAEKQIESTSSMGPYKASTLIDYEKGLPLEINALFLEPLKQARRANILTPRLERLAVAIAFLDAARQASSASSRLTSSTNLVP